MLFNMLVPVYAVERKTSLHNGLESYIKLGRLYVLNGERGKRFTDFLIMPHWIGLEEKHGNWAKE
jgi:hypothetical protein